MVQRNGERETGWLVLFLQVGLTFHLWPASSAWNEADAAAIFSIPGLLAADDRTLLLRLPAGPVG